MRVWIAAVVLLGLAVLGLVLVPRAVDWNDYRAEIEAAAIKLSGHNVTISGPIEIALLPHPTMTARDVTVIGMVNGAVGFSLIASQADMNLEIVPLLAGRAVMHDLRLKRPVLTIEDAGSDGLRVWPPRLQDWTAPFLNLDLTTIGVVDGRVEIKGARPEQDFSLGDLSLELRARQPDGPLQAVGLFRTERHRFTLSAEVSRPDSEGFSAAKLSIDAQNGIEQTTSLRFNGRMTPFRNDQDLRGQLTLSGPDLQYALATISAATGYPATFTSIAASQPFSIEGRIAADRMGIRAEDLQLKLSEKLGRGRIDLQLHPQTRLDLTVDLPTLRLNDDASLQDFLPLDILSKLQTPSGKIDIRLREVVYLDQAARQAALVIETGADGVTMIERAKVELPGLVDVQFQGNLYASEIGPRLQGRMQAVGDDLKRSLSWLDLIDETDQTRGWRRFSLASDVDISSVEIALAAIEMRLDSARLEGKAALRYSERQRLELNLDIERPNLDLYITERDPMTIIAGMTAGFTTLDAGIDLRFRRLNWQGLYIEEGSISASVDDGELMLQGVDMKTVGNTALSFDGVIDLDSQAAELNADLQSQYPVRALRHFEIAPSLTSGRLQPLVLSGGISGTVEDFSLDFEADYDMGKAVFDGHAGWIEDRPWCDLRINAMHPDHQALAGQFGLAPLLPVGDAEGPLELSGRFRHEEAAPWSASGNAKLGPTSFTGSLTYEAEAFASPFEARLSVGTPKWDSLAPLLALSGLRLAGDWTPARWLGRLPGTGLRTAWLEKAEGSLSLASKGGLVGDGLTMEATLRNGLLHIASLEASPWGGRLQAEMTLERRRDLPSAALAVDLRQVEAEGFAEWLGVKDGIKGPLDLHLEASSVGRTPYELMAGSSGEVEIDLGPGEIQGLGVPDLRRTLVSDMEGDDVPAERSLSMVYDAIETRAALSRGVLTFEDGRLLFDASSDETVEAVIGGTADLLIWMVDLTLAAQGEPGTQAEPLPGYRLVGSPDRPDGFVPAGN